MDYTNTEQAVGALRANLSPRQLELEELERYARGTQYEGLPDWFDDTGPLWDRAPCVVYKMTAAAIRSNVSLVLGKGHMPVVSSKPDEDDSDAGGLDEEQSKDVDRALKELFTRVRFWPVSRQALKHAEEAKSVAGIVGARQGRLFLELVRSRWCEPSFDVHGRVTQLEIRYPYLQPKKEQDGKWKLLPKIYRRVIDAQRDVTYLPVDARQDGAEPLASAWQEDKARTVDHKLGFCPVHWYPHRRDCETAADFDGHAIHEGLLGEIKGLDFALSQRHRAALFCGDPQICEIGVDPGYNPSGTGRSAEQPATPGGGRSSDKNPVTSHYKPGAQRRAARIKSPGGVWQYQRPKTEVDVFVLELSEGALKPLDEDAADLRNKIAEGLGVVILDPTNMKFHGDMSGKAIEQIRALQFDCCDEIADDVGTNWILPVALLLIRVALAVQVKIASVQKVAKALAAYVGDDAAAPLLFCKWPGSYMKPDATEQGAIVTYVVAARSAPSGALITKRQAVEHLAPIFGSENVDQVLEELEKESDEDQANALEQAKAHMALQGGDDDGDGEPVPKDKDEAA